MKQYLIRSAKYLLWLILLFTLIYALMIFSNTSNIEGEDALAALFKSQRGLLMVVALFVLALFYPRFGFVRRTLVGDLAQNRELVLKTLQISGFELTEEHDGILIFQGATFLKKAKVLWEDKIIITPMGENFQIEGIRKEVVKIEFRLKAQLS